MLTVKDIIRQIESHPVYAHPMWEHWASAKLTAPRLGALFHQIQNFCASTRPGLAFPGGLAALGLNRQSELMSEIVASESGHGADLATMPAISSTLLGNARCSTTCWRSKTSSAD